MKSLLIHNPNCSKSRGAKEILEEKGIEFESVEYLKGELADDLLAQLPKLLNLEFEDMIRPQEEMFEKLKLAEKELTSNEWIEVIKQYPILLERPIFIHRGKAVIARPSDKVLDII